MSVENIEAFEALLAIDRSVAKSLWERSDRDFLARYIDLAREQGFVFTESEARDFGITVRYQKLIERDSLSRPTGAYRENRRSGLSGDVDGIPTTDWASGIKWRL